MNVDALSATRGNHFARVRQLEVQNMGDFARIMVGVR